MQKSVQSVGCVTGVPSRSTVTAVMPTARAKSSWNFWMKSMSKISCRRISCSAIKPTSYNGPLFFPFLPILPVGFFQNSIFGTALSSKRNRTSTNTEHHRLAELCLHPADFLRRISQGRESMPSLILKEPLIHSAPLRSPPSPEGRYVLPLFNRKWKNLCIHQCFPSFQQPKDKRRKVIVREPSRGQG